MFKESVLIAIVLLVSSGCSTLEVVAPVDAYICYPSVQECEDTYIPEEWKGSIETELKYVADTPDLVLPVITTVTPAYQIADLPVEDRPECPTITSYDRLKPSTQLSQRNSRDGAVYPRGVESLVPRDPDACVVFYSPLMVSQYVEDLKRLKYAMRACERVEAAIEQQIKIFRLQDEIALPGIFSETQKTKAAKHDMNRTGALTREEQEQFEANSMYVISGAEQIRQTSQTQFMDREFVERLRDAVLQVETAASNLSRQAFILSKLSAQSCGNATRIQPTAKNGTWVTKGTVVLRLDQ